MTPEILGWERKRNGSVVLQILWPHTINSSFINTRVVTENTYCCHGGIKQDPRGER